MPVKPNIPAKPKQQQIFDLLVERREITSNQLEFVRHQARSLAALGVSADPAELLARNRFVSYQALDSASRQFAGKSSGSARKLLLPHHICTRYSVFPQHVEGEKHDILSCLSAQPLTERQKQTILDSCIEPMQGLRLVAADRVRVFREIAKVYSEKISLADGIEKLRNEEPTGVLVQSTMNSLLTEALDVLASDIHIEYFGDEDSWIAWRVDGVLRRKHLVPRRVAGPLVMRIKTSAGMDASEARRDQDGRIAHEYRGRLIDFRVSTLPVGGGERIVLRALDADRAPSMEEMFPDQPQVINTLRGLIDFKEKRPGLVVVSGNTGSGKSTTLYSMLQKMPRERSNLLTVENPIEFTVPLAGQYQINPLMKQNMADIERALLRQDLDAAMIGEVRNADSARAAFGVVESGHLCLTTTHAKSSVLTLHRLISFFQSPEDKERAAYILSEFVQCIINQKLVRKLCGNCSVRDDAGHYHASQQGCLECDHQGYKGRVLVHDTMIFNLDEAGRGELYRLLLENRLAEIAGLPGVTRLTRKATADHLHDLGFLAYEDAMEMHGL